MDGGHHHEVVAAALLAASAGLVVLARFVRLPYPVLLVLGGLVLGLTPGLPEITLPPDLVLVIVLPPLLYSAAFFTSLRDLRANLRPIGLLSIGLVLATAVAVAAVGHAALGLPWDAAFVLGAVVAPTDPVAATSIADRLGLPRRIVTVLEGESLINDSSALIVYRAAVVAVVSGSFSLGGTIGSFFASAAGGIAIGMGVGWAIAAVRRRLDDPPTEMLISLVTAYLAYLPAEALGVSAVLAAVTAGLWLGWRAPVLTSPTTRLQLNPAWEVFVFIVNCGLFILVGLQLPSVAEDADWTLVGQGLLVAAAVVVTRLIWVPTLTYLPRRLSRRIRERDPYPPWRYPAIIAWTGMRGAVSLAAALAIPITTDAGAPFPGRDLIIFCAFATILVTLVLQGLTLPALVRALGITDGGKEGRREAKARLKAAEAAIARIDELVAEDWVRDETAQRVRAMLDYRRRRFAARFDDGDDGGYEARSVAYQRLLREVLEAQRGRVLELRNRGFISEEVRNRIERDLDLEDSRLEI